MFAFKLLIFSIFLIIQFLYFKKIKLLIKSVALITCVGNTKNLEFHDFINIVLLS